MSKKTEWWEGMSLDLHERDGAEPYLVFGSEGGLHL